MYKQGHLTIGNNPHRALKGVSYQRCANESTCQPGPTTCGAFAWVPDGWGRVRGRCRLYEQSLENWPFEEVSVADGHKVPCHH